MGLRFLCSGVSCAFFPRSKCFDQNCHRQCAVLAVSSSPPHGNSAQRLVHKCLSYVCRFIHLTSPMRICGDRGGLAAGTRTSSIMLPSSFLKFFLGLSFFWAVQVAVGRLHPSVHTCGVFFWGGGALLMLFCQQGTLAGVWCGLFFFGFM